MQTTPFLMFTGDAESAMTLYCSAIPNSSFEVLERYAAAEGGAVGPVKHAFFNLAGTRYVKAHKKFETLELAKDYRS